MPSLKEFRNRIASVKSTQKITKAMQMVAAAKLKRAQSQAEAARPYASRMARVIANLAAAVSGESAPLLLRGTGKDQVHLLVVMTSERGLCGGFNTQIVRAAREKIDELLRAGKTVKVLAVGKKGRDQLKRLHSEKIVQYVDLSAYRNIGADAAHVVSEALLDLFKAGEFDVATMFFSQFKSVISQVPTALQLIPARAPEGVRPPDLKGAVYEYEPSEEEILEALLPQYLNGQVLQALLENQAGFYGAQMSAMDNATRNAGDMIRKLTLRYNRQRQANITKELIEIISGAEAL
ncbi:F0F1 ATP synthase subunit gamma [Candidatus Viadribacter manganicus]|uniref:ATP synthase gamma chain n=1 Tax=Candidatus Viadribacter manganicus TaxID=1759059 RepID=A0A1B1AI05_9PROT|nr:F0F1 ATP synthase subunit gamma [Candidatus Viadribacter manganicus]ANP46194.1 ATP synthase F0F1 subunit gamma [Candidatus Viadribacter manganicus]